MKIIIKNSTILTLFFLLFAGCDGNSSNKSNEKSGSSSNNQNIKKIHRCDRTWNGSRLYKNGEYGDYCCEHCFVDLYPH